MKKRLTHSWRSAPLLSKILEDAGARTHLKSPRRPCPLLTLSPSSGRNFRNASNDTRVRAASVRKAWCSALVTDDRVNSVSENRTMRRLPKRSNCQPLTGIHTARPNTVHLSRMALT